MRKLTLATILFLAVGASAQQVQWASEVIEFSSELTPLQYSAKQILGKPNVLPGGGESPNAWTPDRSNKEEFVKVGFETPIKVRQISIGESYNPSTITRLYLYDNRGNEHLIYSFNPKPIPVQARLLNIYVDETPYLVIALKLEFNGAAVPDYYSIDAIGISSSSIPSNVEINLPDSLVDNIIVERLSENVNSTYKEYKPLLSPDGKTLYFSRKNHPENMGGVEDDEDIWYSELDENGEWDVAKNAGPVLNNAGPNYISSITPDGNTVVVLLGNKYLAKGKMEAGLSTSSFENGKWTKPVSMNIINDYNFSEKANFFLTNNRQVLLLSVEREDTQGARDLYVSFLQSDSSWSEPKNMGSNVNTAGEEASPFLAADNKTLYFSSNGYAGYGGYDVYVTKRLDDTWLNWSDPENMGSRINSDQEDLFFNIPITGDYAYYSRGMNENDTDIHRVKMPVFVVPAAVIAVRGRLIDSKTKQPIEARIFYERLPDGVQIGITKSQVETGDFEIILPVGELYGFRAEAEGYLPINENIDLRNAEGEFVVIERDMFLAPVEKDVTIVMNNIFFEFDKTTLMEESFPELNRVTKFLIENSTIKIEIIGHTDSTGPWKYNMELSEKRAKAVNDYFLDKGVASSRINVLWFGESKPIETSWEFRAKNRRVEFKIVELDSSK